MRQEGLDPEGKVELAGLLLQIGFKSEAVTEYLMAAQMYEERGNKEEAVKLYEKILELDNDNQAAKRGLEKLKPRSRENIDEMVARMGFGAAPGEEPAPEEPSTQGITTPEETETPPPSAPEGEQKVQSTSEPPERTPTTEVSEIQVEPQPPAEEAEPKVEEGEIDLASIGIEEFLASLMPLLKHTPAELKKRRELASFFREEGLWSEAFFEERSDYLQKPSIKKLHDLLSLLAHSGDKETLITFFLTESLTEREVELQREVLKALAVAYEEQGRLQDAKKIREKLATLASQTQKKKKPGVKIIEDVPRLSEEDTPKGKKKPADPIQFV
ncbi:MAG: tetratricopeptide repeat protein [Candidatus Stahlbacteria bacterium]|nr:MAG: tetratricopeptide repeat protein [Candidatus Stahlbacteria bacterium]